MTNDLFLSLDSGYYTILIILDLLAASVDTVDHSILLDCLNQVVGIQGQALQWFASFLQDWSASDRIDNVIMHPSPVEYHKDP